MYRRVKRETFYTAPDVIVAAASLAGAPLIEEASGLLLKVFSVSGGQLGRLEEQLEHFCAQDARLGRDKEIQALLAETRLCSHLYIASTSVEVVLVSDRSRKQFEVIRELYLNLTPDYTAFKDGCLRFVTGLKRLGA